HATRNSIIDSVVACVHPLARTLGCGPTNATKQFGYLHIGSSLTPRSKNADSKPSKCAAVPTQQKRNASRSAAAKWLRSSQLVPKSDTRLRRQTSLSSLPL